jgi:hypothetical protein
MLLCANSVQIGLLETDESRLVERDTQVDFKHGLEHGPRHPLSVKVDATGNAGSYRLQEILVALGDDEDLAVLQVPALQLPVGGGVQGDPQCPGESFSCEFEESYLWFAVLVLHAERVVWLVFHALSPPLQVGALASYTPLCGTVLLVLEAIKRRQARYKLALHGVGSRKNAVG